jgi:hypothetical protein
MAQRTRTMVWWRKKERAKGHRPRGSSAFHDLNDCTVGVKSCPAMKHLYPCDNNWGARGNRHADRVAKPLCPKDNNGFRDGA